MLGDFYREYRKGAPCLACGGQYRDDAGHLLDGTCSAVAEHPDVMEAWSGVLTRLGTMCPGHPLVTCVASRSFKVRFILNPECHTLRDWRLLTADLQGHGVDEEIRRFVSQCYVRRREVLIQRGITKAWRRG